MSNPQDKLVIPEHIAIILDGNGRWAKQRGRDRFRGHREGARRVDEIATACKHLGVKHLTVYAFSTENWNRPRIEVNALMRLLVHYLKTMDKKFVRNQIKFLASGQIDRLPQFVQREINRVKKSTSVYPPAMSVNFAISYGGRQELLEACEKLIQERRDSDNKTVTEDDLKKHFYNHLPDPDLLIRTGGEQRVSNFLLWQIAYSEFYFTDTLWPDFDKTELMKALEDYSGRQRRFGKTQDQIEHPPLPAPSERTTVEATP